MNHDRAKTRINPVNMMRPISITLIPFSLSRLSVAGESAGAVAGSLDAIAAVALRFRIADMMEEGGLSALK
jgi:hypothetical protein